MAKRIGFIGTGNMAGAIIGGILKKEIARPAGITVYDIRAEKTAPYAQRGLKAASSIGALSDASDVVFLSVKPQNYEEVLAELAKSVRPSQIIVSIAAGISTSYIRSRLGSGAKVVRVMPNTPLLLGEGASALCRGEHVTEDEFDFVKDIFASGGVVEELPEDKMNAVIAVNGSSPAYVYLFAKAVIDEAAAEGIDAETAKRLISKTLVGSAKMLTSSGKTPDELITMVSSPGGTTLKALEALYEHGFEGAVADAMRRCTKRAEELGR